MNLNIKDPEVHELAKSVSKETGESLTVAVKQSLRERLERLRRHRTRDVKLAELIAFGERGAKLFPGPYIDHADLLYDENGLPK